MKGLNKTSIPYLSLSWPIATGCLSDKPCWPKCWARGMAHRFHRDFTPTFHPDLLDAPLRSRAPAGTVVGVAFTGDLGLMDYEQIAAVLGVCARRPDFQFVVTTKRPAALAGAILQMDYASPRRGEAPAGDLDGPALEAAYQLLRQEADETDAGDAGPIHCKFGPAPDAKWPLDNIHLGFSAWDQNSFDDGWEAMAPLAAAGWRVWCSLEPMIGEVDVTGATDCGHETCGPAGWQPEPGISGIILGSESGHGARPLDLARVRTVRDQCAAAGVAFSYKQGPGYLEGWHGTDPKGPQCLGLTPRWHGMVPVLDGRMHVETPWGGTHV